MSAKIMQDLALKLSADTAELKKGVREANNSLKTIETNTADIGKKVTASFGKITAAVIAAQNVLKSIESVIRSTQNTNDAFDQSIAAATGSLEHLSRAIANADFSNLINGMREAAAAARELKAAEDEISDIRRGISWQSSDIDRQISELRVIAYDKSLPKAERLAAIEKAITLEKERQAKEIGIAQMNLDAVLTSVQRTYNLTDVQLEATKRFLRNYGDIGVYGKRNVDTIIQLGNEIQNIQRNLDTNLMPKFALNPDYYRADVLAAQESIKQKQQLFEQLKKNLSESDRALVEIATDIGNNFSDVLRDSIATAYIEINNAVVGSNNRQRELIAKSMEIRNEGRGSAGGSGTTVRSTETELSELETLYFNFNNAVAEGNKELAAKYLADIKRMEDASKKFLMEVEAIADLILNPLYTRQFDISGMSKPESEVDDVIPTLPVPDLTGITAFNQALKQSYDTLNSVHTITEGVNAAFNSMFGDGVSGAKDFITMLLRVVQGLLAQAIATMIASESQKGLFGLISASIGVGALTALWQNKVPEFASGALVYGDILARVGEYPGAKTNPEVIAPLNDLKRLLPDNSLTGEVRFVIEEDKLVGILNRHANKQIYF